MTTPHVPKVASALACLVATACAAPQSDGSTTSSGYRVVVSVERHDGVEQHLLDIDAAGAVRSTMLVAEDEDLELSHARPVASPDGRWLFVDRGVEHDSLGYFLYDLHALSDAESLAGERLAVDPRGGDVDAKVTFSPDSSVLAVVAEDGLRIVSLDDPDGPSDALDLDDEEVYQVFTRPGSPELLIETEDNLWWHRGNADDERVRVLVEDPEPLEVSPFLDSATFYYDAGSTWALAAVIDGIVQDVQEIELISEEDPTAPCSEFQPFAEGGTIGGVCFGGSRPYWVDGKRERLPWSFHDEELHGASSFVLTPGGRYLAYAASEEYNAVELGIYVVDLATHGDAKHLGSVPDDVLAFGTCFDETYVINRGVLHRLVDLDSDAPGLVEVGTFAYQDDVAWYCMPDDAAAVFVTGRSVVVLHADAPDVLDTRVTVDPDRDVRGVGPGDAARFVYRETCPAGPSPCDTHVMELPIEGGETVELLDAPLVGRPLIVPRSRG